MRRKCAAILRLRPARAFGRPPLVLFVRKFIGNAYGHYYDTLYYRRYLVDHDVVARKS